MRKAFLKAPVKFSRISSRFSGKRFHPVLKRYKAHLGTDYAAPHGTPIVAVGDGTVSASSFTSGNGNYVKIRHNSTYETQYLHMSKRAVKAGDRVQQGDVIGYVGSTGLATGPHVCFRFWKNGQQVDHLSEEFPASEPIPAAQMENFNLVKAQFDAWMNNTYDEQPNVSFIPSDSSAVL
jgi:murein DD-endopeptidase MepM/ murein hydrolase activator NlpD